ncbi:MAG: glycosyltransferase [Chloroflexi bacterium]|nr:glycosyltransferase [Chloroflexota bacterium]
MHILLVADGRSPITHKWIQGLVALNHEVTLVSSFPCPPHAETLDTYVMPVAFAGLAGSQAGGGGAVEKPSRLKPLVARWRGHFQSARYWLGPATLPFWGLRFRGLVRDLQPDLIHALRIPFESMLASFAPAGIPLVVSTWGNDLTLHSYGSSWMQFYTRRTLRRADGLLSDTRRDLRLAQQWGFAAERPGLVVPGSGGIDLVEIHRRRSQPDEVALDGLPPQAPLVLNPRGFRPGSVRNDIFFAAIPLVLERRPEVYFVCPAMAGQEEAWGWINRYKIHKNVRLLPHLSQLQLWKLFLRAQVTVSLSEHDGTPNSLLEAMALGCFPICGDIESLREWIHPGVNGLLVEPTKPQALAEAILLALEQAELRNEAAAINSEIIRQRAEVSLIRSQVQVFYDRLTAAAMENEVEAGEKD